LTASSTRGGEHTPAAATTTATNNGGRCQTILNINAPTAIAALAFRKRIIASVAAGAALDNEIGQGRVCRGCIRGQGHQAACHKKRTNRAEQVHAAISGKTSRGRKKEKSVHH